MTDLLDAVVENKTITTYTRSWSGSFDNPWVGAPALTFHMQRVKFLNDTEELLAAESLPSVHEPYAPGKVYDLYNPQTGDAIPGQTVTAEMVYAILYSVMRRAVADAALPPSAPPQIPVTPDP